jgi:hypothetical protein
VTAANGSCPGPVHAPPKPARSVRALPWQRAALLAELAVLAAALVIAAVSLVAVASGQWLPIVPGPMIGVSGDYRELVADSRCTGALGASA